ncbi:uncharacterized protein LOC129619032 isoform X2 [Condylostylus longicornis]|uniref:uncharacterized protein LOC129619032 isoform X2 n=1 Tax=Condylostylus longicornis TaxID=2530218 RepID=UPI00244E099A|nr:uncharacterized protein LOC129619032 isoform X2 [Condylostylus longicornis]
MRKMFTQTEVMPEKSAKISGYIPNFTGIMDALNRLRRPNFSPFSSSKTNEPLIVVEESNFAEEDEQESSQDTPTQQKASLDIDSPCNPYLLSPWRDPRETRKHSLPSQQVTEGITASQVRRLSERGGEGSGPSPKEAAFLATLSQAPAPSGRRHSVVTISKMPTTLFGRSRRESVAAIPGGGGVLGSRRESGASVGPPSTDPLGSIHNLQLDIMDDIVQSRKARMKLWTTSNEKVCEVQIVDETGNTTNNSQRYTNRRYSDFIALPTIPSHRRASEQPNIVSPSVVTPGGSVNVVGTPSASGGITAPPIQRKKSRTGLLGSRTELSSIFSNLTSSAIEINKVDDTPSTTVTFPQVGTSFKGKTNLTASNATGMSTSSSNMLDPNVGRSTRSNSFDVSILHNCKQFISDTGDRSAAELSGWFAKRHAPIAKKKSIRSKSTAMALSKDMLERLQNKDLSLKSDYGKSKFSSSSSATTSTKTKNKSDNKNSSHMDAHMIGSAIEGFLRKSSISSGSKGAIPKDKKTKQTSAVRTGLNWFTKNDEDDTKDSCESSLCSTLKDLFVK